MSQYLVNTFNQEILNFNSYVLGIDIGGTNTNLGVAGIIDNKPRLIFSLNFKTNNLTSIIPAIKDTLNYAKEQYNIGIKQGCIGAAGVVSSSGNFADLTNVKWNVKTSEITQETELPLISIINDFQAIGYGLNLLDENNTDDIFIVKDVANKEESYKQTKAILGAGTGLGKSTLIYDKIRNTYIPKPSEGGHSDFPAQNSYELELMDFLKNIRGIDEPVCYEELLSGRGIEGIYKFLKNQSINPSNIVNEIESSDNKPELIFRNKNNDEICRETVRLFTKFYGRCAKNFILDTMAMGGLYIAGGIASKNKEIFTTDDFLNEFKNAYQRQDVLNQTPIYVIMNYNVSLFGACYAAMLMKF